MFTRNGHANNQRKCENTFIAVLLHNNLNLEQMCVSVNV